MSKVQLLVANEVVVHRPGVAGVAVVTDSDASTWRDMEGADWLIVVAANAALTGRGITRLEIVAAADATGTGLRAIASIEVLDDAGVGRGAFLQAQYDARNRRHGRFWAARITVEHAGDVVAVSYVRAALIEMPQPLRQGSARVADHRGGRRR